MVSKRTGPSHSGGLVLALLALEPTVIDNSSGWDGSGEEHQTRKSTVGHA